MRISLAGRYTIDEFAAAFGQLLENLRISGIREMNNVNVYLNLHDGDRPLRALDADGNEIQHLRFDGPRYRRLRTVVGNVRVAQVEQAEAATDREIENIAGLAIQVGDVIKGQQE